MDFNAGKSSSGEWVHLDLSSSAYTIHYNPQDGINTSSIIYFCAPESSNVYQRCTRMTELWQKQQQMAAKACTLAPIKRRAQNFCSRKPSLSAWDPVHPWHSLILTMVHRACKYNTRVAAEAQAALANGNLHNHHNDLFNCTSQRGQHHQASQPKAAPAHYSKTHDLEQQILGLQQQLKEKCAEENVSMLMHCSGHNTCLVNVPTLTV